jgi:hypothetical protein
MRKRGASRDRPRDWGYSPKMFKAAFWSRSNELLLARFDCNKTPCTLSYILTFWFDSPALPLRKPLVVMGRLATKWGILFH